MSAVIRDQWEIPELEEVEAAVSTGVAVADPLLVVEAVEAAEVGPLEVAFRDGDTKVIALTASFRLDGVVGADLNSRMKIIICYLNQRKYRIKT